MLDSDCQFKIIDNNEFPLTGLIQVLLYIYNKSQVLRF
jgi:hypothetical protein